jgi:hypothetical protein
MTARVGMKQVRVNSYSNAKAMCFSIQARTELGDESMIGHEKFGHDKMQ